MPNSDNNGFKAEWTEAAGSSQGREDAAGEGGTMTEAQLKAALKAAVLGLRELNGMTGYDYACATHIKAIGYRIAEQLGMRDDEYGYHPLEAVEKKLK